MSTWEKAFDTFQWENRSQSTNTPLDATHLNKVNDALDVIDDRVIELQSADADMEEEIAGKQDALTFDDVPTDGSNNPVKSNGIYDALNDKVDKNGTDRLMTADEGTKLAGIAAGAQVNVLEGVVVDSIVQPISGKKAFIDLSGKTNLRVIAFPFHDPEPDEPQITFLKGAYVTYNGKLYEFIQEHTGAWNPSHVREIRASGQYVRAGNGGYNNGDCATCEGYMTKASGNYSHAEGRETQAVGDCTHAEGRETIANGIYQHVEGKYNVVDNENKYIHIIGNGIDDNNRSNAMTVDWDGNVEASGEVEDGNGEKISNKADKVTNATSGHLAGLDSNGNLTDSGVSPTEDVTVEGNPVTFDSPFEQDAKSVVVSVKPIQDLHGLPFPYVGGAYKNKLPLVLADIKAANTDGTWNGNVYSINGGAIEVLVNNADNVLGFKANGTFTGAVSFPLYSKSGGSYPFESANHILNGCPQGGSGSTYKFDAIYRKNASDNILATDFGASATADFSTISDADSVTVRIVVYAGTYSDLMFYPMIRLATESDATFAPYSNECPISGIDEVEIEVSDGESEPTTTTIPLPSTLYGGTVRVDEGSADSEYGYIASYNGETLPGAWISDRDVYTGSNSPTIGAEVAYELATPITLSFDPTDVELLEGTNVVTTNGEKVAVTYGRSLWQDIDKLKTDTDGKLNKSDVADVEGDTASRPYSVNEFMLRSDGFYKVTQPIAQNASITSSNTTKTTVGEVLTTLLNA